MPMYRKLTTAAAVAALTLGLAACGGGGSDGPTASAPPATTPPPTTTEPTTPMSEVVSLPANTPAGHEPMAGEPETIAAGASYTSGGVVFTCADDGEACVVTVADDGTASSTGGMVTAALTDEAQMAQETAALAMRDRIIGQNRAIEGAGVIGNTLRGGVADIAARSNLDAQNIGITRGPGAAARVRIVPTAGVPAPPAGYAPADTPAMANGAWAGTRLSRSVGANTDTLVVYTDIEAPTRRDFYNWDGDAMTPRLYVSATADALGAPADATTTIDPLALVAAGAATPGLFTRAVLDPTKFPQPLSAGDGQNRDTFRVNADANGDGTNDRVDIRGNFNGAPGTYQCTPAAGTSCIVTVSSIGTYASPDTWNFIPELNAQGWNPDGEFMSFGWWMRAPAAANGAYAFSHYADGTPYAVAGTVRGTATYTGRAAGRYVVQELDDGGVTGGEAGEFTAAASLSANFSAQPAPTIEGSISDFQGENGPMAGWTVTLERKSLVGAAQAGLAAAFPNAQSDPTAP